ncbi:hypothetical protein [Rhizobium sp. WYCCWR 11128]|uniref:hypothetical protein n=1 Tax=Rhizobium sp. WYCCWR 11128 TaxID=2749832 RepID=UPI0015D39D72|nr:hypothetical protein [Rhizobium sp. WYCCWR 11128]NYT30531.1 hypothetical protein [Rhizobium sp. WYCCWR 11128]
MRLSEKPAPRTRHDEIIGTLPHRPWFKGKSLLEDIWPINTEREEQERAKPVELRFDVPIRGWPHAARLNDAEFEDDLISAKLLMFLSLEPKPIGWMKTASSVGPFHRRHLNYIRWRVDRGLKGNRFVGPAHHRDYEKRYRRAGLEGLLDLRQKAEKLVAGIESGAVILPEHPRKYFFHEGIEALLGLSRNQTPPEVVEVFVSYARAKELRFNRSPRTELSPPDYASRRKVSAYADLSVFYHLGRLRDHLKHDPIGYDAYSDARELSTSLGGWVKNTARTDDSPAYQTSVLINSCLSIILSSLPERIIDICLRMGSGEEPGSDFADVAEELASMGFDPVSPVYSRLGKLRNSTALTTTSRELLFTILVGCCVVVIAAFSARRNGELMSLRPGSVTRDKYGELWLETWISKRQRYTTRAPANNSVARAVDILEKIRTNTERFGEREWLLEYRDNLGNVNFEINPALKRLSKWLNVPPLGDGTYWEFASHQFRKFFAVAHQWRYFFPELLVLNHQLRQLDKGTTIGYCKMEAGKALRLHENREIKRHAKIALIWSAEDRLTALQEEEQAFVRHVCEAALRGELKLGGVGGRTLYNDLKRRVSAKLEITSVPTQLQSFNDSLEELISSLRMQVHPEGHSVCTCGASLQDKEVAGCLALKQRLTGASPSAEPGADYGFADEEVCAGCPKNVRLKQLLHYWDRQVEDAEAAIRSSTSEVRDQAKSRKQYLLEILSEFDDGD